MDDYDCQSCGACCWLPSHNDGYTPLTPADIRRLPINYLSIHKKFQLPVLRDKPRYHGGAACIALAGRIGQKVSCTVYEDRPLYCRTAVPGDKACKQAIRRAKKAAKRVA